MQEINKTAKSKSMFETFKREVLPEKLSSTSGISEEELFIEYYRALQLYIIPNKNIPSLLLIMCVEVGRIEAVKRLQKVLGVEQSGLITPVTRWAINNRTVSLNNLEKEFKTFSYKLMTILNLF